MHSSLTLAALAAVAYAAPAPQAPPTSAPAGCLASYTGRFQIAAINITTTAKRSLEARQSSCDGPGALTLTLNNGQLVDSAGRIGSIVANRQFQFDGPPPQAGAIYTSGWSACTSPPRLAIGGSTTFYQCLSGTFYNLYDQAIGAQCNPVTLQIQPCSSGGAGNAPGGVGAQPDGQPTNTGAGAPATQIGDGQIQAPTGKPISQIGDGQVQAPTGKPPVSQIGDGQIQAPTGKPISQISDGQIQAPKPTAKPISQISDGQVQAPKPTANPVVSQISDGQIQAPATTAKAPAVTQISDGQVQSPAKNTTTPIQFTGAASPLTFNSAIVAAVLGLASVVLL